MSKESKAGKVTCRILKEIRQQIANANDIKFVTSKCRYQGDCLGTCPKCFKSVKKVTVCGGLSTVEAEEKHVVKGIVVDKCGNSLIGAVVTERGLNNSTTTDREGHFLLRGRKGRSVLEVSSEGMKTKKIKVRKKKVTKIKVVLRKDKHRYKQTINANL